MSAPKETEIAALINARMEALRISKVQLIKRCGFENIAKGLRRLSEICEGDFARTRTLLEALSTALSVDQSLIEQAVHRTLEDRRAADDQHYRQNFRPHAIIVGERNLPEPIWLLALIGMDRLIRLDFEEGSPPLTYVEQAKRRLRAKLKKWHSDVLPCFGRPTGFVVNYDPDNAIEFDLGGRPVRGLRHAMRGGEAKSNFAFWIE